MSIHNINYGPLTDSCIKNRGISTANKDDLRGYAPFIAGQKRVGENVSYKDKCVMPLETVNTLGMNDYGCFLVKKPGIYKPSPEHMGVVQLSGKIQRTYDGMEDKSFQGGCEVVNLPDTAKEINYNLNWAEKQEQDRLQIKTEDWNRRIDIIRREIADLSQQLSFLNQYNHEKDVRYDENISKIHELNQITPPLEKDYNSRIVRYRNDRDAYNNNVDTITRLVYECNSKMNFVTVYEDNNFNSYNNVYRNPNGVVERTGVDARSIFVPPYYEVTVVNTTDNNKENRTKLTSLLSTEENISTNTSLPNTKDFVYTGPEKYVKLDIKKTGQYNNTFQKITD